jgi:deoxyhypusine synthase
MENLKRTQYYKELMGEEYSSAVEDMNDNDSDDKNVISSFIERNFKHFNAAALVNAAKGYKELISEGGKMLISLAGAMSTAELGISLAEMIRQNKVHAISCTGANLEEDVFNLIAHSHYVQIPKYRDLTPQDEKNLVKKHLNRVTDTCIPEKQAMKVIEKFMFKLWENADKMGMSYFPHEYLYQLLLSNDLKEFYEINPKNSWMLAAAEKNIPIVCPGWEDSSLGNIFASEVIDGKLKSSTVKGGIDYMKYLANIYPSLSAGKGIGFFQIGGGIAGDFPICVVPLLKLDLDKPDTPFWSYFCQISDAITSYGGYSGAMPNEKITWSKVDVDTPTFVIESDASIVAPLIFAYVLEK